MILKIKMTTQKINKYVMVCFVMLSLFFITTYGEDLYRIKIGKEGYSFINSSGELKISTRFSAATYFEDGIAFVRNEDGKRSGIDSEGNMLFSIDVHSISSISDGLAVTALGRPNSSFSLYGYIEKNGEYAIEPKYEDADVFQEGLAVVTLDPRDSDEREYFFINKKGEDVFKTRFSNASGFVGGYSYVEVGARDNILYTGYVDTKENLLKIPTGYEIFEEDNISDGYLRLTKNGQYSF